MSRLSHTKPRKAPIRHDNGATKDDAQCDKLAMVVDRTELTRLATVNVPWRNFSKSTVSDKVPECIGKCS